MSFRCNAAVILLFAVCLISPAVAQAPRRVAIVSSFDDKLTAIIEASVGGQVQLVDRAELGKVLAEQKMAGLMSPEQAVSVGRLLRADLLVSIEPVDSAGHAVVAFDAVTGRRVADAVVVAEKSADETAARLASSIKDAVAKSIQPNALTVCLLNVRNADLPRQQTGLADAVGPLFERRLVESPTVAVLERNRLDKLTKERQLGPAGESTERMLTSVSLIELQLSRTANAGEIRTLAVLTDHTGKELSRTETTTKAEAAAIVAAVAPAVLAKVGAAASTKAPEAVAEAKRFVKEASFLAAHHDYPPAVRAMESAHALDPTNLKSHLYLVELLCNAGINRQRDNETPNIQDPPDRDRQFMYMRRALDQLIAIASLPAPAAGQHPIEEISYTQSRQTFRWWLNTMQWPRQTHHIAGRPPEPVRLNFTAEQSAILRECQADYRRLRMELEKSIRWSRINHAAQLASYTNFFLIDLVADASYAFNRSAAEGSADVQALLVEWADAHEKYKPESRWIGTEFRAALAAANWPPRLIQGPPESTVPTVESINRLRVVYTKLSKSFDPTIAEIGQARLKATEEQLARLAAPAEAARPGPGVIPDFPDRPPIAPKVELIRGEGFWDEFQVLVDTMNNDDGLLELQTPVIRDDAVYVIAIERRTPRPATYALLRFPLKGGEPTTVRRFLVGGKRPTVDDLSKRIDRLNKRNLARSSPDTEKYLVMGTTLVPFDPAAAIIEVRPQEDWPANQIQALTVLGETLYVAVGEDQKESFLIEQPLKGGPTTVLVSSRRKEKQSPFDDMAPMIVSHLGVDLTRNRILFDAGSVDWPRGHSGIWEYVPATRKFRQLVSDPDYRKLGGGMHLAEREHSFGPVYHDRLPIYGSQMRGVLNLKTDAFEPSLAFKQSDAVIARSDSALWTGLSRQFAGNPEVDVMPALRPGLQPWMTWPTVLCPLDERRMLIGDRQGLFIVVPPKDAKGKPVIDSKPATRPAESSPRPPEIATRPPLPPQQPSAAAVDPAKLPWSEVAKLYDFAGDDAEFVSVVAPQLQDDAIYAVGFGRDESATLLRFATKDGSMTRLSHLPGYGGPATMPANRPAVRPTARMGVSAMTPDAYCFASQRGLLVFPLDAAKPVRKVAIKLLGNSPIAAVSDRLFYVDASGAGPQAPVMRLSTVDLKADPPATQPVAAQPLENLSPLLMHAVIADPERGRVLFVVHRDRWDAPENGLWSYTLATGEAKNLQALPLVLRTRGEEPVRSHNFRWMGRSGDTLLIALRQGIVAFDLKAGTASALAQAPGMPLVLPGVGGGQADNAIAKSNASGLLNGQINPMQFTPPLQLQGQWLWFAGGRVSMDGQVLDTFPPLRPGEKRRDSMRWHAVSPDGKFHYAADSTGCWKFTLKP